jgi:2,4-dienoyl-CoA reductase-like NADH-dependent reductase (Old Yellow Enzyme family)
MTVPLIFPLGRIDSLEIRNRTIMAAMDRNHAGENGVINAKYIAHTNRVARGCVDRSIPEISFEGPDVEAVPRRPESDTKGATSCLRHLMNVSQVEVDHGGYASARGAGRAQEAGCDFVELHVARAALSV